MPEPEDLPDGSSAERGRYRLLDRRELHGQRTIGRWNYTKWSGCRLPPWGFCGFSPERMGIRNRQWQQGLSLGRRNVNPSATLVFHCLFRFGKGFLFFRRNRLFRASLSIPALYCDRLYVMKSGRVAAAGKPREVLTRELIREIYEVDAQILEDQKRQIYILYSRKGNRSHEKNRYAELSESQ